MRRQRGLINSKELSIQSITVLVVVFAKTESSSCNNGSFFGQVISSRMVAKNIQLSR